MEEIRGQLKDISSFLLPYRFVGSDSGLQALRQVPLLTPPPLLIWFCRDQTQDPCMHGKHIISGAISLTLLLVS